MTRLSPRAKSRCCPHCHAPLVKIYGENATRAAKRRYCNRACVDAAKQAGDGRLNEERMPWPADHSRVDWRMRSSLAGVVEMGEV